jgi:hypothetical protein
MVRTNLPQGTDKNKTCGKCGAILTAPLSIESGYYQVCKPQTFRGLVKKIGWQHCWREEGSGGISLPVQFHDYNRTFGSWPDPDKVADSDKQDETLLTVLARTSGSVYNATDTQQLQQVLIISNANEFRLRDNPTEQEFEAILLDWQKWMLRKEAHVSIRDAVEIVVVAARKAFKKFMEAKS